ncbi:MAG: hypothetical protein GX638_13990, partial [Crenarchaeota archaeon]|nr:hypothetical protein [Thermoproteota archaeon]
MKTIAAWSGGKDSCFACYKAAKAGSEIVSLFTFMHSEDSTNFHAIPVDLLDAQAAAIGIPLVKRISDLHS